MIMSTYGGLVQEMKISGLHNIISAEDKSAHEDHITYCPCGMCQVMDLLYLFGQCSMSEL